jgi:hypothetical protein
MDMIGPLDMNVEILTTPARGFGHQAPAGFSLAALSASLLGVIACLGSERFFVRSVQKLG